MNSIFTNVLLVVHVAVCLLLGLVVLMQRPKQEGLGAAFGGGMTDQAFGARTTDVLQKGTAYLGALLFVVALILAVLVGAKSKNSKIDEAMDQASKSQLSENVADLPVVNDSGPLISESLVETEVSASEDEATVDTEPADTETDSSEVDPAAAAKPSAE